MSGGAGTIKFGPFEVTKQVFLKTRLSFALVNIKPLMPGHVLVCPLAPHLRLTGLSADETADLFATVQRVQLILARRYFSRPSSSAAPTSAAAAAVFAGSFNVAIQDGPDAGQTVPHVHVHIFPRPRGSTSGPPGTQGEEVYAAMGSEEGNVGGALWDAAVGRRPVPGGKFGRVDDMARKPREAEAMHREAEEYVEIIAVMEREEREQEGKMEASEKEARP